MNPDLLELYALLGYDPTPSLLSPTFPTGLGRLLPELATARVRAVSPMAVADTPDPGELPPLDKEQSRLLLELLEEDPQEVLAAAREAFDANLTLDQLRANLLRADEALANPGPAADSIRAVRLFRANTVGGLPRDFSFPGMNLEELPIDPSLSRYESVHDSLGWVINGASPLLGKLLGREKAPFRSHAAPPYTSDFTYSLPNATAATAVDVALLSDFGADVYHAFYIARHIAASQYAPVIHLGDVYYGGRRSEFVRSIVKCFTSLESSTPIFQVNSNHEMDSGAWPYFEYMDALRSRHPSIQVQEGSYFCLRNETHQLIGLDTSYYKNGRLRSNEPGEDVLYDWLRTRLEEGKDAELVTILLTQHEPYAYGGGNSKRLYGDLQPLVMKGLIHLWFWGNTHYCALFDQSSAYPFFGSCIGHAGYPFERQQVAQETPVSHLFLESGGRFPDQYPRLRPDKGRNGYCAARLRADKSVHLTYIDWMSAPRYELSLDYDPGSARLRKGSITPHPLA